MEQRSYLNAQLLPGRHSSKTRFPPWCCIWSCWYLLLMNKVRVWHWTADRVRILRGLGINLLRRIAVSNWIVFDSRTYWYHSHLNTQYCDGLRQVPLTPIYFSFWISNLLVYSGPLVIYGTHWSPNSKYLKKKMVIFRATDRMDPHKGLYDVDDCGS